MDNTTCFFGESVRRQLQQTNLEVIDIVSIPSGDRLLRLKALQEVLVNLSEEESMRTREYLIRVKARDPQPVELMPSKDHREPQKPCMGEIYLPNGKLNVTFLMKNAELLFDAGDFVLARKIYNTILRSGEMTATVLHRLGKCYEAEGKTEIAHAKFEEATFLQMGSFASQPEHLKDRIPKSNYNPSQTRS